MTRGFLQDIFGSIADRGRDLIGLERQDDLSPEADLVQLSYALLSGRGEASGVALARRLLKVYEAADKEQRRNYIRALADRFGPDERQLDAAVQTYLRDKSQETMAGLSTAAEPRRQEVIRRINRAEGGTAALVRMREDVLGDLPSDGRLKVLDDDFVHLFSSWFNRGFLQLRRIDWTTPANILAKIIEYEAVHTIKNWQDLRNRLEPRDRRCFAFFHPQMADEPLVFVEVALTREIPHAIAPILDLDRRAIAAEEANIAVFYSISNCQTGLRGVSFGSFLIKQVVEELRRDLPRLTTFVTLSPVPGFIGWLKRELDSAPSWLTQDQAAVLKSLLQSDKAVSQAVDGLREAQMFAAAHYLLTAKTPAGKPVDAVARFHLGNGARLERINWQGDVSANGLKQAGGLMVNYLYDLDAIETNHEALANLGKIAASPAVQKLLKSGRGASTRAAKQRKPTRLALTDQRSHNAH